MIQLNANTSPPLLSIVIPVYNEGQSIPLLLDRLDHLIAACDAHCEVLFVDDHSTDHSGSLLRKACAENTNLNYLRLSRNSGSHTAILAGLDYAKGDCAVFLAADLQDPPELIPQLIEKWKNGYHVVWAVRERREGIPLRERILANAFYFLMNTLSEVTLPPTGADFALLDRRVVRALLDSTGADPSLASDIASLGFQQAEVKYVKMARKFGRTTWTLSRRLKAFADAFAGHSFAPIRSMSYLGVVMACIGLLYAVFVISLRLIVSSPIDGWASLMVVALTLGGTQMVMLGVLGEYLVRTLRESRRRPRYFLEDINAPLALGNRLRNHETTPIQS